MSSSDEQSLALSIYPGMTDDDVVGDLSSVLTI